MSFLEDRTPRERALVFAAIALAVLMMLWQFVVMPIEGWRSRSIAAYEAAQRDHQIVVAGLNSGRLRPGTASTGSLTRAGATDAALRNGVSISRVQPGNDDSLRIWFDRAPARQVYSWIDDLVLVQGATLSRVTMEREDDGFIAGDITVLLSP